MGFAHRTSSSPTLLARALRRLARRLWPQPQHRRSLDVIHPTVDLALSYPRIREADTPNDDAGAPQQTAASAERTAGPAHRVLVVRACAPGRLVISGRMADVCAELNRLAAQQPCGTPSAMDKAMQQAAQRPLWA